MIFVINMFPLSKLVFKYMIVFSYPKFVCFRVAKATYKTCKRGETLRTYKEKQPGLMEEKDRQQEGT